MSDGEQNLILKAIDDLRDEMKADSKSLWTAITKLNDEMSTGKGAVKALMWVGGVLIAIGTLISTLFHGFRH